LTDVNQSLQDLLFCFFFASLELMMVMALHLRFERVPDALAARDLRDFIEDLEDTSSLSFF
jgi:hypothetical protein